MVSKLIQWLFLRDSYSETREQLTQLVDKLLTFTGANKEGDSFFFITICFRCYWITLGEPDRYKVFCEKCQKDDRTIVRGVHRK